MQPDVSAEAAGCQNQAGIGDLITQYNTTTHWQ